MDDIGVIISALLTIVGIVLVILKLKVDPVIALVVGSLVLALINGLAPTDAIQTVLLGFGELLGEIGLLIIFGILAGSILTYLGAIQRLAALLLRVFGKKLMPYAFGTTIGTVLSSIFVDVCLVITAPLARQIAPQIGKHGIARMASSIMIGVEVGLTMTIPGVAALALSGLLGVPVGTMILCGVPVAIATIISSIAIMSLLFRLGFWNPELDEAKLDERAQRAQDRADELDGGEDALAYAGRSGGGADAPAGYHGGTTDGGGHLATRAVQTVAAAEDEGFAMMAESRQPHVALSFLPLIIGLALIITGAIASAVGFEHPAIELLSDPTVALLIALIGLAIMVVIKEGRSAVAPILGQGFRESGQILVLTGVGGCLAAVVQAIGVGDILLEPFAPGSFMPLLIVWVMAAVLHLAIGSVTTSAITAAGMLAPLAGALGINPVLIALAAGAGSMFVIHFTSNTFWMLQGLFGLTTRGGLKTCTVAVTVASVMGLVWVLVLSLFV